MVQGKKWYKSKAIWGSVVAVVSLVGGAFGYTIGAEDQELLAVSLSGIGVAAGNILAVYGRAKAKDKLEK
jgi:hypothetical protein